MVVLCAVCSLAELYMKLTHFQWVRVLTNFLFVCLFSFFLIIPSQSPLPTEPVQRPGATSPPVCFHLFLVSSFALSLPVSLCVSSLLLLYMQVSSTDAVKDIEGNQSKLPSHVPF